MTGINNYGEMSDNGPKGILASHDYFRESYRISAAIVAMQGMLTSGHYTTFSPEFIALRSVEYADALINELSKKKDENDK